MSTPQNRLQNYYNANVYDPVQNPGGMNGNGVAVNWNAMAADMAAVGLTCQQQTQMVATYLAGSNGWVTEAATLARLSTTQFTVAGGDHTPFYKPNRALSIIQTASGYGYVSASSFNATTNLTTVTVTGLTLDTGFSGVSFGQDPANAPLQTTVMTGATAGAAGTAGQVPAPVAGQENSHFCGDGTYHDPAIDNEIWS